MSNCQNVINQNLPSVAQDTRELLAEQRELKFALQDAQQRAEDLETANEELRTQGQAAEEETRTRLQAASEALAAAEQREAEALTEVRWPWHARPQNRVWWCEAPSTRMRRSSTLKTNPAGYARQPHQHRETVRLGRHASPLPGKSQQCASCVKPAPAAPDPRSVPVFAVAPALSPDCGPAVVGILGPVAPARCSPNRPRAAA